MQTGTLTRGQTENDDFSKGAVLKVFMCLVFISKNSVEPAGRLVLAAGCPHCRSKGRGGHRTSTGT